MGLPVIKAFIDTTGRTFKIDFILSTMEYKPKDNNLPNWLQQVYEAYFILILQHFWKIVFVCLHGLNLFVY